MYTLISTCVFIRCGVVFCRTHKHIPPSLPLSLSLPLGPCCLTCTCPADGPAPAAAAAHTRSAPHWSSWRWQWWRQWRRWHWRWWNALALVMKACVGVDPRQVAEDDLTRQVIHLHSEGRKRSIEVFGGGRYARTC
jgi:hypothetical protein